MTPIERRYADLQAAHPGCLALLRVGDFYEAFGKDAEQLGRTLGLTLTTQHYRSGKRLVMAGFPYHTLHGYLAKLVKSGLRAVVQDADGTSVVWPSDQAEPEVV